MATTARPIFLLPLRKAEDETETLELRYGWREAEWFERNSGRALYNAIAEHFGPTTVTWLLLAGLRHARPDLGYDEVREKIERHLDSGGNLPDLSAQMFKCLRQFGLLKPIPGDEEDRRPPVAGALPGGGA